MGSGKKSARKNGERDVLTRMSIEAYKDWLRDGEGGQHLRAQVVYKSAALLASLFDISFATEERIHRAADVELRHEVLTRARKARLDPRSPRK